MRSNLAIIILVAATLAFPVSGATDVPAGDSCEQALPNVTVPGTAAVVAGSLAAGERTFVQIEVPDEAYVGTFMQVTGGAATVTFYDTDCAYRGEFGTGNGAVSGWLGIFPVSRSNDDGGTWVMGVEAPETTLERTNFVFEPLFCSTGEPDSGATATCPW